MIATVLAGCNGQEVTNTEDENIAEQTTEAVTEESSAQISSSEDSSKDDSSENYEDITDYDSANMMNGESLTDEDILQFQDYISQKKNMPFVVTSYRTPSEMDTDKAKVDFGDIQNVVCTEGVRSENLIQLIVSFPGTERYNRRITLLETEDSDSPYMFYSNRQLWEENADKIIEASNYGTDEKTVCGIVTDYGEWGPEIDIIEDNSVASFIVLAPQIGDRLKCTNVKDIEFCDIDKDSYTDMIAILEYENETIVVLCGGSVEKDGKYKFSQWKDGYSDWLSQNISNMTADNVANYILEHQDEFNDQ